MSEIVTIRQQFQANLWPQFIENIHIKNLRALKDVSINFNFPIVAIVGENGTGKSTVLKSLASCYNSESQKRHYYPSDFFIDTQWDVLNNVEINYRIKLGNVNENLKIAKRTQRWSYPEKEIKRFAFFYDIARTLPLEATVGYAKIARNADKELSKKSLQPEYLKWLKYVLGKDYSSSDFITTNVSANKEVGVLEYPHGRVSQFHQGAGEDTIQDLFMSFQSMPDYSLLIIDEVEASLHPRAQKRLVQFLLWFCRIKRIQIIISTHSQSVLSELPLEARLLLMPSNQGVSVVYGISTEFAMSRIDDNANPALTIFVEDSESEIFLREILISSSYSEEILPQIQFNIVGPANVVTMLGALAADKKLPYNSLAVLDGDYTPTKGCISLPGELAPEKYVYSKLKESNWNNLDSRFGIGAGTLFTILDDSILDPEHHNWSNNIGDRIKLSGKVVWLTVVKEFVANILDRDTIEKYGRMIKEKIS